MLLVVIASLWVADLRTVCESRALMVLLNLFFTWLAALSIGFLTARGFLSSGQPGLLMFGCGSLLWGCTSVVAAMIVNRVNTTITIHNLGIFGAASCHLVGLLWQGRMDRRGRWLMASYAGALITTALIIWAAAAGMTPVFFVQGHGGTPVRQVVLILAIAMFAWVAWQMVHRFWRHSGDFYYWYGLGLALVATGLTGVLLLSVQGGILGWTNRLTQYLGSAYLLLAAVAAARETGTWKLSLSAVEEAWLRKELLSAFQHKQRLRFVSRYGSAVLAVAVAFGVRQAITARVGPGLPPFLTFGPAVMAVALFSGFGPALLALLLTVLISTYWFFPPVGQFAIAAPVDRLAVLIYIGTILCICVILELYRRNREKAAAFDRERGEIAERKRAEAALRHQAELLDKVSDAVVCTDADFRIQTWNRAAERIYGWKAEEALGKGADSLLRTEFIVPASREEAADQLMETGFTQTEVHHHDRHGRILTVHGNVTLLKNAQGDVIGSLGVLRDVTERNGVENALRVAHERISSILETMSDGFAAFDRDWRYTHVNPAAAKAFRTTPGQLLGKTIWEMWPPAYDLPVGINFRRSMEENIPLQFECYYPAPLDRWFECRCQPTSEGLATFFTDITERKRAEEEQQRTLALLDTLVRFAPIGFCFFDLDLRFVLVNERLAEINGIPADRHVGRHISEIVPTLAQTAQDVTRRILQTGDAVKDHEFSGETLSLPGIVRHWNESWYPIRTSVGEAIGFGVLVEEITERKRSEEELRVSAERLKASLREKEALLKEIHHRVKNNMQVISSLVSLQADALKDPALRGQFQDVRDRVRSMALVHEKLYQSNSLASVEFAEYTRSLMHYLWRAHGSVASGIRLSFDLQPVSIPIEMAVPCGLILNELAVNALKHAFQDRSSGEVIVSLRSGTDGCVRLSLRDDGVGLPPGMDWRQSSSLGLRLVQMLAGQLNGTVEIGTGEGTEFVLTFQPVVTKDS